MRDHRGVSLVELIVVMAIMAVLAGAGVSLFGTLTGAKVSEASDKITAALSRTRTEALSRSDASFTLYQNTTDKRYYVDIYYTSSNAGGETITEAVGASQLIIKYYDSTGAENTINTTNSLKVKFDRSTGAIKPFVNSDGTVLTDTNGSEIVLKRILITSGDRNKNIQIFALTGKYSVE